MNELSLMRLVCDPEYATYTEAEIARKLAAPLPRPPECDQIPDMIPPTVLTLLAADRVARHRDTGRFDLYGVFHALNLRLPTRLTFAAYYVFTACHAPANLDVVMLGPDDEQLARGPVHIPPAAGPLDIIQSCGTFEGVLIDRPGTYRLRIDCAGEVLAERPILIGPGV